MLLKYFYDTDLAQASYLVGSPATGEALIIDPARNIEPYLKYAQEQGLRLIAAAETHIHADFVSGGSELAAAVDGKLYISAYGDEFGYRMSSGRVQLVREDDVIRLGSVKLEVMHTPGHTPEHICYLLTDTNADQPFAIFSGDCLFVGDMGRPDLLEVAVGAAGSTEIGSRGQFANMQRLKNMPDYLQVLPGHGAGSVCGKALGHVPSSTLGYEKLFNPSFQFSDEDAFVNWLLADQPPVPPYFAQMKKVNQQGATQIANLSFPRSIVYDSEIEHATNELLIDTRNNESFAQAHIPGSINIPAEDQQFAAWAGWFVDYTKKTFVVVHEDQLSSIVTRLRSIGVDNIGGYVRAQTARQYRGTIPEVTPQVAAQMQREGALILDVRNPDEYQDERIPNVLFIPMGEVQQRLDEIPRDREVIVHCEGGTRSQLVASLLQKHGYRNVNNMDGGIRAWRKANLPLV